MVRIETIEQIARLVPTISALLAGFSFTMVRGLILYAEKPRLTKATSICFIAAAAMLVVTFDATYLLIHMAVTNGDPSQPNYPEENGGAILHVTRCVFYAGLISLLTGVGLPGWLHSRRVGIVGSIIVLAAAGKILRTIILPGVKM